MVLACAVPSAKDCMNTCGAEVLREEQIAPRSERPLEADHCVPLPINSVAGADSTKERLEGNDVEAQLLVHGQGVEPGVPNAVFNTVASVQRSHTVFDTAVRRASD
jgi:hypothetical protein